MVELTQIAKCSLCIVWTLLSARRHVSRAHKHVSILRTKVGACVSIILVMKVIFMFSHVASLGKYAAKQKHLGCKKSARPRRTSN